MAVPQIKPPPSGILLDLPTLARWTWDNFQTIQAIASRLTSLTNVSYPLMIQLNPFLGARSNVGFITHVAQTSLNSSGAQDDEIVFDIQLSLGIWTLDLMHTVGNDRGIYTVSVDDTVEGTIDGYDAAFAENQIGTITNIEIIKDGNYKLKLKMASKNAASSAYKGSIQLISLRRAV